MSATGGRIQVAALDPKTSLDTRFSSVPVGPGEPFGIGKDWNSRRGFVAKWRTAEREIRSEMQVVAQCRADPDKCPPEARRFIEIVDAARKREGRARIGEINRAINLMIRPMTDLTRHGVADVWTSPLKTVAGGQGDCEDYALAKLAALREAGVAEEELRLMVIHEPDSENYHAVAAVRLDGRWIVLDNRRLALLPDSAIDARPIGSYSFGETRSDPNFAFASGASESAQSFGDWTAPALLM